MSKGFREYVDALMMTARPARWPTDDAGIEAAARLARTAVLEVGPCSSEGCEAAAVFAVRFHGQAGHVHDCGPHTADLREFSDVAEVMPVARCPWTHGVTWTEKPRDLT